MLVQCELSITSAGLQPKENDPHGIHIHGQCYPEWVNVGHGHVVMLQGHKDFDGPPLGLAMEPLGIGTFLEHVTYVD